MTISKLLVMMQYMKRVVAILTSSVMILIAFLISPNIAFGEQNLQTGSLIKIESNPAVYYLGNDNKRYVFPNEQIYFSWYKNFDAVMTVSGSDMASIAIGGNIHYRPGIQLVKLKTDPKVYSVGLNGILRWVTTEEIAQEIYGPSWATLVHDLPEAFFQDYQIEKPIQESYEYHPLWPIYKNVTIESVSIDPVQLSDIMPIYPNSIIQISQRSALDTDTFMFYTSDAVDGVKQWYKEKMEQRGWAKGESLLYESILDTAFGGRYEKDISGTSTEWIMTIDQQNGLYQIQANPIKEEYVDTSVLPVGTPIPEDVELITAGNLDEDVYGYTGLSIKTAKELFIWLNANLEHVGWHQIAQADQEDQILRQYERSSGSMLRNVGLFLIPLKNDLVYIIFADGPSTMFDERPLQEMAEDFLAG